MGMQIIGKGYENTDYYKNAKIEFLDIDNIHKVRDSYNVMCEAMHMRKDKQLKQLSKINDSK